MKVLCEYSYLDQRGRPKQAVKVLASVPSRAMVEQCFEQRMATERAEWDRRWHNEKLVGNIYWDRPTDATLLRWYPEAEAASW